MSSRRSSTIVAITTGATPELGLAPEASSQQAGSMTDLRERVPGHSLIDELIRQWELGNISVDEHSNAVIAEDAHGWYRGVLGEPRRRDTRRA